MSKFTEYLDKSIDRLHRQEEMLKNNDRQDEANFARIKGNICDIARTVYDVFVKIKGDSFAQYYADRLAGMRGKWEEAKALAEAHDDIAAAVTEGVKIDMMREIEAKFSDLRGEEDV